MLSCREHFGAYNYPGYIFVNVSLDICIKDILYLLEARPWCGVYTWKLHTAAAVRRPAPAEDRGQCQLRAQRSRLPPAPPAAPAAPAQEVGGQERGRVTVKQVGVCSDAAV